jgi:uncharacterized coiled-coil DUF342 family protein
MTPWQEFYFKTVYNFDGYGRGYSLDLNQLFPLQQIQFKDFEPYNKKEETKMQNKFDQILALTNKKQELEKQLSEYLLEISRDERDLKEIQKTIDKYNIHMNLMKESYVKTSKMLFETDQKLKEIHVK